MTFRTFITFIISVTSITCRYNIYNIQSQSLDISKVWFSKVNTDKNKRKSSFTVLEVNCKACIDHHNKKGDGGKDQILWRRKITWGFASYPHEKRTYGSPVPWIPFSRDLFQHLARATASFFLSVSTAVALSSSSAFLRT